MFAVARDPARTAGVGSPEQTENERRLADLIKVGRVVEADYALARVRVGIGDPEDPEGYILTGWLPMSGGRSDEWNPPQIGEAVTVLSEGGELQNGVVLPGSIYNTDHPAVGARGDLWRKDFRDGSSVEYDLASKTMRTAVGDALIVMSEGAIALSAGGTTLTIDSDGVTTSGKIIGQAGLEISGEPFVHNGKDVGAEHRHIGVQTGSGTSGVPA